MFRHGLTSAGLSIFWSTLTELLGKDVSVNCFTDYLGGISSSVCLNHGQEEKSLILASTKLKILHGCSRQLKSTAFFLLWKIVSSF